MFDADLKPILQRPSSLSSELGIDLTIVRDDLLPFPLAGNKVRKIKAELSQFRNDSMPDLLITNGAIDSNHCRTVAIVASELGIKTHLVLHGDVRPQSPALNVLSHLKATYEVVDALEISSAIKKAESKAKNSGSLVHVVPGGGHSLLGARSYCKVGVEVFTELKPNIVFLASGTGATQGGLIAAAEKVSPDTKIIGISVARTTERGVVAIHEAAVWSGAHKPEVTLIDRFLAGGYGKTNSTIDNAVQFGWKKGIPLDYTYTGKAFAALLEATHKGTLDDKRVLFWHTGGLWNFIN